MTSHSGQLPPVRFQPLLSADGARGIDVGRPLRSLPYPLDQPRIHTTFSGTAAVFQAVRALALPANSVVLCPSYNCGHEIEPLLRLDLGVECYRVMPDLSVDLDDIECRITADVRAVMVTHYFGFAQPLQALRELCDRRGLYLIEDCAHALLSDDAAHSLGRTGDAVIYSIRKTVPVPNGGAFLFNNNALSVSQALRQPPALTTWLKSLDMAKKSLLHRHATAPSAASVLRLTGVAPLVAVAHIFQRLAPRGTAWCYDPDDEDFGFGDEILEWGISSRSLRLLHSIDWSGIASRRRDNYRILAGQLMDLGGCQLLRCALPDGTCPLFLPVLVEHREAMFRHLVRNGVHPGIWWEDRHPAVRWSEFPEACDLKQRVLALPIHQDLDRDQLLHVARSLSSGPLK